MGEIRLLCTIHHLISRAHTRREISKMFDHVTAGRSTGIRLFRRTLKLFVCRSRRKLKIFRIFSRLTGQDKEIGGLIMDGQLNEACQESDLFLEDRLNKGVKLAAEEIEKYSHALDTDGFLSMRLYRNYEEF
ncbi:MAG: hypothetical protein ACLTI1_04295 [Clostridia bacterium]